MMLRRFIILFSFLVLSSWQLLSISACTSFSKFALECPKTRSSKARSFNSHEQHLVFLKTSASSESIVSDHLEMLKKCLGRRIENFKSEEGRRFNSRSNEVPDKKLITVYSVSGIFAAYSGYFDNEFARNILGKRKDVNFVEKVIKVKANYAVNRPIIFEENHLEKRAIQTNAPFNLDRIDQKNFPLDGKYSFPDKAGSNVNVYVVDTIAINNVEFEGRAKFGGTFCSGCSSTDDHGHGTNVAGIIGGKKFGVSKKTNLIAVRVLDKNGQGSSTTVVAGLNFVLLQHSNSTNKNTIINLSLGGAFSQAINKMVSLCTNAGIHVVASAGDNSGDACNVSPASAPEAITVGATETSTNNITNSTNFGNCVEIFAPGRDITAAGISLKDSLSKASGTSQACPHVTGAIALIINKNGNAKPSSMVSELIALSVKDILINAKPNRFLNIPSP